MIKEVDPLFSVPKPSNPNWKEVSRDGIDCRQLTEPGETNVTTTWIKYQDNQNSEGERLVRIDAYPQGQNRSIRRTVESHGSRGSNQLGTPSTTLEILGPDLQMKARVADRLIIAVEDKKKQWSLGLNYRAGQLEQVRARCHLKRTAPAETESVHMPLGDQLSDLIDVYRKRGTIGTFFPDVQQLPVDEQIWAISRQRIKRQETIALNFSKWASPLRDVIVANLSRTVSKLLTERNNHRLDAKGLLEICNEVVDRSHLAISGPENQGKSMAQLRAHYQQEIANLLADKQEDINGDYRLTIFPRAWHRDGVVAVRIDDDKPGLRSILKTPLPIPTIPNNQTYHFPTPFELCYTDDYFGIGRWDNALTLRLAKLEEAGVPGWQTIVAKRYFDLGGSPAVAGTADIPAWVKIATEMQKTYSTEAD